MAIRDKFRRAVGSSSRKSTTSSSSSSSSTHAAETASTADSESSSSSSPCSPIAYHKSRARTFTWRPAKSADDKEQQKQQQQQQQKKKNKNYSDPREKPFTEMNLRYQEILSSFELTFGTSHPEQLWNPDGELSPGTSRQNSIDLGRN